MSWRSYPYMVLFWYLNVIVNIRLILVKLDHRNTFRSRIKTLRKLLKYLKYFPETLSKVSSTAHWILVCAPSLGNFMMKINSGHAMLYPGIYLASSVITTPGWSELAVTPVPANKTECTTHRILYRINNHTQRVNQISMWCVQCDSKLSLSLSASSWLTDCERGEEHYKALRMSMASTAVGKVPDIDGMSVPLLRPRK